MASRQYAPFKIANPKAEVIVTTMDAYEGRTIDAAYNVTGKRKVEID